MCFYRETNIDDIYSSRLNIEIRINFETLRWKDKNLET